MMKTVFGYFLVFTLLIFSVSMSYGQATTLNAGNWGTAANWSTGTVPGASTPVVVMHAMNLNQNLTVQAKYIFNATASGNPTLNMSADSMIINANVSMSGGGNNLTGGVILVKSGYTFTISGISTGGSFKVVIEPGATMIVNGNINNNGGTFQVNGTLTVNGNYSAGSSSGNVTGSGTFTTTGSMGSMNGGAIFGNPNQSCSSNCNGSTLCGTAVSIAPGASPVCAGNSIAFTSTVTPTPTAYEWQSSTNGTSFAAVATGGTSNSYSTTPSATTYYRLKVTTSGCSSYSTASLITVNAIPSVPTAPGVSRCGDGTLVLEATGSTGTYNWYDDALKTTLLISDDIYTTPSLTNSTDYYVSATNGGTCESSLVLVTATVNTVPAVPSAPGVSRCGDGTLLLEATGSTGTYNWYDDALKTTLLVSNNTYTTLSLTNSYDYYVSAEDGSTGCESALIQVTATITPFPAAPVAADGARCGPGVVTLTASGSTGTYNWYQDALGSLSLSAGTSSYTTPSLSSDNGYYVSSVEDGCESGLTLVNVAIQTCTDVEKKTEALKGVAVFVSGKELFVNPSAATGIVSDLKLYSAQGKMISVQNSALKQNEVTTISLENLPQGIYMVQLKVGGAFVSDKVWVE